MGVKYLNTICNKYCQNAIIRIKMSDLKQKYVVVDTSIYMYRYKGMGNLLELFEKMIKCFKKNEIELLCVFDGKPREDKSQTMKVRHEQKMKALATVKKLEMKKKEGEYKEKIEKKIEFYKKQSTRLRKSDIQSVKSLIEKYEYKYIQAENESDEICANLANSCGYIVMSEDMDLFVYGCKEVLKNPDIESEEIELVMTDKLLDSLNIGSIKEFQQICIIAGTDYNTNEKFNIYVALYIYMLYKLLLGCGTLFEWCKEVNILTNEELNEMKKIEARYNLELPYINSIEVLVP